MKTREGILLMVIEKLAYRNEQEGRDAE